MKKIFRNSLIISLLGFLGCNQNLDETGGVPTTNSHYNSSAYMGQELVTVLLDPTDGAVATIEPRLASISNKDEVISVSIKDFLEEYNEKNFSSYRVLPADEYELFEVGNETNKSTNGSLTVTVKAGKISSPVGVRIKALDQTQHPAGIKYALPFAINSASVSRVLSNNQSLLLIQRPAKTSVAHIKEGYAPKIKLDDTIAESSSFTLQAHMMLDSFRKYDCCNYNMSMISYGWYSRINASDINLSDTVREMGVDDVEIKTKTWYQVTYVYENNSVKIYLNGRHIRTFSRPNIVLKGGGVVSIFNPQMSYSVPHILRELRVWNRALTEDQIKNDLYGPIDPESKGLVAYVPVDKLNGYNDITPYNNTIELHKATSQSKSGVQDGNQFHKLVPYSEYGIDKWYENVEFPNGTLQ